MSIILFLAFAAQSARIDLVGSLQGVNYQVDARHLGQAEKLQSAERL
ncbi:uncharacterized protein ANIA_11326 [Aspergillus nidulans FGSC A4]|uniref:Uncharacterized protein n=1 Tax=Emericella nidulans (strain FGSC A4 / ATCC 38163 / CBS 112.46 / NRRL 194 / M139) TaxID=227321 RepID=C8VLY7_EMENI|nr:hypothetical protein [Aspergillus nidulans FGSC A4]CBF86192.1 TPA: hypothetical protein ANIA_11326 [Aspergillus nidulans FGSC A4]